MTLTIRVLPKNRLCLLYDITTKNAIFAFYVHSALHTPPYSIVVIKPKSY